MLTHVRLAPRWFACRPSPPLRCVWSQLNVWARPEPPSAQSSFARPGRYPGAARWPAPRQRELPRRQRYYELMRQTNSLRPPRFVALSGRSLQVVVSPCWKLALPDVISVVCVKVLGPLPRSVPWLAPFVNQGHRPRPRSAKLGTLNCPCNATSTGRGISGRQSFDYLQAPQLARPPDCTYRSQDDVYSRPAEQPGLLHHAMNMELPP